MMGKIMPKISKVNSSDICVSGTALVAEITATYSELVLKFGVPIEGGDRYKTDAEWDIEFEDGSVATIYNWKDGENYLGEGGLPVEDIKEWHIGGHSKDVARWITDYVFNSWPIFDEVRQASQI
jgi:hypothetical protein